MDNDSLDKTRLIGALTTLIYAQNLPHHTKNTLYKYADFIILWNKSYEALKKHKDEISEYEFYSQHIQKPPEQINATHTIKTSPFSSLVAIEDSVMQNIREQARQEVEEEFKQKSFIQRFLKPDSYPNVLEGRKYIPVVVEICFLFIYIALAIFALGSLSNIRKALSSKKDNYT